MTNSDFIQDDSGPFVLNLNEVGHDNEVDYDKEQVTRFLEKFKSTCPVNLEARSTCEGWPFRAALGDLVYQQVTVQDQNGRKMSQGIMVWVKMEDFELWFFLVLDPDEGTDMAFSEEMVTAVEGSTITLDADVSDRIDSD